MISRRGFLGSALALLATPFAAKAAVPVAAEVITASEVLGRLRYTGPVLRIDLPGAPWMHHWSTTINGKLYDYATLSDSQVALVEDHKAATLAFRHASHGA